MGLFDNVAFWVTDENERAAQAARVLERDAVPYGGYGPAPSSGFKLDEQASSLACHRRTFLDRLGV
ncbi:hypothetical protein [Amycolatopsis sp. NPDC059657]|uniref:hypothetical protein n=1 Tax=Amycolatopsis sp. NPDC059657 TaxID=3346899 RepID=UPI00366F4283